jgi:16S rRNA (uracil1498-N3)-methyltransferase
MKFSKLSRVYTSDKLIENQTLSLDNCHTHYLKNVLRLKVGDKFRIFNGECGEFTAQIIDITKSNLSINLIASLRKPITEPVLILGLCIIKNDRMLDAINMAVQLGATGIIPVISERSQFRTINIDRLQKCIIEATEQSERLNTPYLGPLTSLNNYNNLDLEMIIYANENELAENSMTKFNLLANKLSLIIGPEGGFTEGEIKMLASWQNSYSVSLSSNVLRSETAACVGLAQLQLIRGNYARP